MKLYRKILEWTLHLTTCALLWLFVFHSSTFGWWLLAYLIICFISAAISDSLARWAVGHEQNMFFRTVHRLYIEDLNAKRRFTAFYDLGMSPEKFGKKVEKTPDPDGNFKIYRVETVGIQIFGKRFIWNRTPKL